MPRQTDHSVYLEWLYLEADGVLEPAERAQLQRHLLSCPACRKEKEELPVLFELLASDRVELSTDFTDRVMSSLPSAGWEARHPRAWISAAAVIFVLSALSALLVGVGYGEVPGSGALAAIVELFGSAVAAGAGLMTASWQGLGMAIGDAIGGSRPQTAVFALFVLGLDVLFLRFLLRSWRAQRAPARSSEPSDE